MTGRAAGEDFSPRNLTLMVCDSRLTQHDVKERRAYRVSVIALSLFLATRHEASFEVNGMKCRSEDGGNGNNADAKKHGIRIK